MIICFVVFNLFFESYNVVRLYKFVWLLKFIVKINVILMLLNVEEGVMRC